MCFLRGHPRALLFKHGVLGGSLLHGSSVIRNAFLQRGDVMLRRQSTLFTLYHRTLRLFGARVGLCHLLFKFGGSLVSRILQCLLGNSSAWFRVHSSPSCGIDKSRR